jgi:hypothetical protein
VVTLRDVLLAVRTPRDRCARAFARRVGRTTRRCSKGDELASVEAAEHAGYLGCRVTCRPYRIQIAPGFGVERNGINSQQHLLRSRSHAQERRDHRHRGDPGGRAGAATAAPRRDEGGRPELQRQPGPDAGRGGHPGQLRRSGPTWTPLIRSTMPPGKEKSFGKGIPLGRPGQPTELAPAFVLLAFLLQPPPHLRSSLVFPGPALL